MRAAVGDHLQEPTTRVLVLCMFLEVSSELVDLLCQKADLHCSRASIGIVFLEGSNYLCLLCLSKHVGIITRPDCFCNPSVEPPFLQERAYSLREQSVK